MSDKPFGKPADKVDVAAAASVDVVAVDPPVVPKVVAPVCPHCKRMLREEHDLGSHLHCDGPACISCCFDPGEPPTLRSNSPLCPAA